MRFINKNAKRMYLLLESFESGIVLFGHEVKSIKSGRMQLLNAYVKLIHNIPYLINANIPLYKHASIENYNPHRSRALLLHKNQILKIQGRLSKGSGLTIVPVSCYTKAGKIKIEIALAQGKKSWERKTIDKKKSEKRRIEKEIKEHIKK